MKSFKELLNEKKGKRTGKGGKLFVFASWENGVLKWSAEDDRSGSDPMKKKPSKADVIKHLEKVLGEKIDLDFRMDESVDLDEALQWITVHQGDDHTSSIGISDKEPKAFVTGVIPHGAKFMFDRREVSKIIKLLKMKDSPIVKD